MKKRYLVSVVGEGHEGDFDSVYEACKSIVGNENAVVWARVAPSEFRSVAYFNAEKGRVMVCKGAHAGEVEVIHSIPAV